MIATQKAECLGRGQAQTSKTIVGADDLSHMCIHKAIHTIESSKGHDKNSIFEYDVDSITEVFYPVNIDLVKSAVVNILQ